MDLGSHIVCSTIKSRGAVAGLLVTRWHRMWRRAQGWMIPGNHWYNSLRERCSSMLLVRQPIDSFSNQEIVRCIWRCLFFPLFFASESSLASSFYFDILSNVVSSWWASSLDVYDSILQAILSRFKLRGNICWGIISRKKGKLLGWRERSVRTR